MQLSTDYRADLPALLLNQSAKGFERLARRILREAEFTQVVVTGQGGDCCFHSAAAIGGWGELLLWCFPQSTRAGPMNFRPNLAWVRPFLVIALVVSVPPLLYWFGYVSRSVDAAVRQYNTTTSAIAASLAARLHAHEQIATSAEDLQPDQNRLAHLLSLLDGTRTSVGDFRTHLTTVEDERGLVITVRDPKNSTLSVSVKLESLILWDMVEADFDGLLLLSSDGRLLAQDRRLPEQARGLPIPVTLDGRLIDVSHIFSDPTKSRGTAEPSLSSGEAPADPQATAARSAWRSPLDFSRFHAVVVGGTRYVAFVQPVRTFTAPVNVRRSDESDVLKSPVDMLVVALVQEERLRSQAISLSPQTLVRVIALVGLGLLLIPFLKLRFIGANERMRARDLWVMMGAMLGISAVATLLVMDGFATRSLIAGLDNGLVRLHEEIQGRAALETEAVVQQLRRSPAELSDFNGPYRAGSNAVGAEPRDHCGTTSRPASSRGDVLLTEAKLTYPAFDTVFLVNAQGGLPGTGIGQQTWKWMPRSNTTGLVNVASRRYFRDALALDPADESGMGVQFIVSMTTGLEQLVFALPMKCEVQPGTATLGPAVAPAERTHVAAISTVFRSLSRTVVAAPYQFLLVDHDGTVTFRNAKGPYLGERFFERVLGGMALAPAVILPHAAQAADYSYRWQRYRMLAKEVPDLGMSLVTSYDVEEARQLAARAFGVALLVALLSILSTLLGALLATAIWSRSSHDWVWPAVDDTGRYIVGIVFCALAVIALIAARELLPSEWFAVAVVTVPGIVTFLCGSPLWFRYRLALRIWADGPSMATHKIAYCAFLTGMLLALAVVPTVLAYDDALRLYASGYERASATNWFSNARRLQKKFEEEYARVDPTGGPHDVAPRCNAPGRICANPANYDHLREILTSWGLYTPCPAPLRHQDTSATDCDSVLSREHQLPWSFTGLIARPLARIGEAGPLLSKALNWQDENPTGPDVRPLEGWQKTGWLWWVWAAAGLALLVALVRSVAVHVLGLGWRNQRPLGAFDSIETEPGTRWLLIRPTKAALEGLAARATRSIDLRHSAGSPGMVPPQSGEVLLVKHLETALEDPELRDSLFALTASPAEGCLVFCSEIDPFNYVTQRAREAFDVVQGGSSRTEAAAVSPGDSYPQRQTQRARWASLLCDFRKIRFRGPDFPGLGGHVPERCRRILESECGGSEPLIEIAQRLAMSRDLPNYREDEIVRFVLDEAEPLYRSLWELCSREERLVLIQLAEEGVVNPKQFDTLRRLHTRGLVVVEPRFDVMNSSFRQFLRSVENPERVREWEQTEAARGWRRFSAPLYTMAAVIIGVLLFTQQDLFSQVLGIATGAAGALNSLRSIGLLASASKAEAPRTVKV